MVSGWYTWILRSSLLLFIVLFLSCNNSNQHINIVDVQQYNLQSGDVVCRLGNGFFSNYFRKYASKEQKYSHIGIIEVANDSIFVIHTEASELTGIGYVKREPIHNFLNTIKVFGFYRIECNKKVRERIIKKGIEYYQQKVPFDLDFRNDNDEFYCTELVAETLNYAFDSMIITPNLKLGNKKFYGLDDIYQNKIFKKLTANSK